MLEYLKSKEDFVDLIVKHLGTSAVMDLLLRLITSVESPQLRQDLLEVNSVVCGALFCISHFLGYLRRKIHPTSCSNHTCISNCLFLCVTVVK